ncbi:TraR/DksA C4-type zinc finger protein [Roseisalinus antarcticus]|uniref:RNA polymerase-binding transcription factor DksA n=1 Tax=Roseisalinus antarcticus TaxID=254357 RepID=A0A1Y5TX73_9RHOB|nr:TraR/DksA C4-type zinc finger protein [Roseisalinus antarcticus]SLN75702.1 RNA polymerase-binding transcription factor DksA [Roseisalinus antarcticus]
MSSAEPTDADLADRYRPRLAAERAELEASSAATGADRRPVELDQQSVGRLSRMDALQGQAMAKGMEARRAGRLRAIAAALARIDAAEFGFCDECGDFIGFARLDLDPCAARCTGCAR